MLPLTPSRQVTVAEFCMDSTQQNPISHAAGMHNHSGRHLMHVLTVAECAELVGCCLFCTNKMLVLSLNFL